VIVHVRFYDSMKQKMVFDDAQEVMMAKQGQAGFVAGDHAKRGTMMHGWLVCCLAVASIGNCSAATCRAHKYDTFARLLRSGLLRLS